MRGELEYRSSVYGECPSDYDFKSVQNSTELEFLKRTDILQGTLTRLKYNIEMYDYFLRLYILNKVIKDEFEGFISIFLSDLSMLIAIDFSSILENSNLSIYNYQCFCNDNSTLFTYENIEIVLQQTKPELKKAHRQYTDYFKTPRDKLFAHMDETLLNRTAVDSIVGQVSTAQMTSLLQSLMKVLSSFWFAYNGKQLCFEIKKGDDYKKLAYTICKVYGDTKFI